jgi:hypothetical protein
MRTELPAGRRGYERLAQDRHGRGPAKRSSYRLVCSWSTPNSLSGAQGNVRRSATNAQRTPSAADVRIHAQR